MIFNYQWHKFINDVDDCEYNKLIYDIELSMTLTIINDIENYQWEWQLSMTVTIINDSDNYQWQWPLSMTVAIVHLWRVSLYFPWESQ